MTLYAQRLPAAKAERFFYSGLAEPHQGNPRISTGPSSGRLIAKLLGSPRAGLAICYLPEDLVIWKRVKSLVLSLRTSVQHLMNQSYELLGTNGGAIIDHEAPRERRLAAVEK